MVYAIIIIGIIGGLGAAYALHGCVECIQNTQDMFDDFSDKADDYNEAVDEFENSNDDTSNMGDPMVFWEITYDKQYPDQKHWDTVCWFDFTGDGENEFCVRNMIGTMTLGIDLDGEG